MSATSAEREPCAFCGAQDWVEAHFTCGRLVCATCFAGRQPATPQPTSPAGRAANAAWIAPRQPNQAVLPLGGPQELTKGNPT